MIEVWLLDCTDLPDHESRAAARVHPQRYAALCKIVQPQARALSLGCDLLLSHFVENHLPALPYPPQRGTSSHGKPYLLDQPDLSFNLSHCRNWAVLAAADVSVGVDLQCIRQPRPGFIERFFHPAEACALAALPHAKLAEAFTAYWTIKESVIKMRGTGLHTPLSSFAVTPAPPGRLVSTATFSYALVPPPTPDYALGLCWADPMSREIRLRQFSLTELLAP